MTWEVKPVPGGWALTRVEHGKTHHTATSIRSTLREIEAIIAHLAQPTRLYSEMGELIACPTSH